jgi:hypothetical protein
LPVDPNVTVDICSPAKPLQALKWIHAAGQIWA